MTIVQALEFRGGSHDGVRHEPFAGGCPFPDTLWRISWNDGESFARTDQEFVDEEGRRRVVFRHDPDGALSEQAKRAFSGLPEPTAELRERRDVSMGVRGQVLGGILIP